MRQIFLITGLVVLAASGIVGFFAFNQVNQEQIDLTARMQSRSQVLADSLSESIEPSLNVRATTTIQRIIDKFVSRERLAGLGVFDNQGSALSASAELPQPEHVDLIVRVMDSDEPQGEFIRSGNDSYYDYVVPLHDDDRVTGALLVAQNVTYIDDAVRSIWWNNIVRLFSQLFLFAVAVFALVYWVFIRSIAKMAKSLQDIRRGDTTIESIRDSGMFGPLTGELAKVTTSLRQARFAASEEARMRLEKIDSPWTAERLGEFVKSHLKNRPLFVISNREPYVHTKVKGKIEWSVPAGGVVTALEPVMAACGGMWIAHGSGSADKETADDTGKIQVPPDEPKYTLKRVWLTEQEENGYYTGFSNEALWPLCHMAHVRPLFRAEDWEAYRAVNAKFAISLLEEVRHIERPIILVQDFHLSLVPAMIKKSRPDALVALFWHIAWPSPEQFSICPWRKELLQGILGADLVGFHTQHFCNNFIETVAKEVESRIDYERFTVIREGHETQVKPFPISIAYSGSATPTEPDTQALAALGITASHLILGVDRLDYVKGILERFKGIEFLLEEHPEYRGEITLLQISAPSRESVEKYREYAESITGEAARINEKLGTENWKPIVLEKKSYSHKALQGLYRAAKLCLITTLHDGMNLVAKEFAAARDDGDGVLILSQFAGASRDLKGALLINPYSAEETSAALHQALTMKEVERRRRMKMMRQSVSDYNVYRWSAEILKALSQLESS